MSDYVLSLSYGKDSLACIGAIQELGWPLTRIVHAEVWATDTIPADLPPMVEFKSHADKIIKDMTGITVEHFRSPYSFQDCFYMKRGRTGRKSKFNGKIYGFPMVRGQWCLQQLKLPALRAACSSGDIQYLGIAFDEPNRFHNLSDTKKSPLVELEWTENQCFNWCLCYDLVSPIYSHAMRGGCWFCHCQSVSQLRFLRSNYPDYWELMLKWDKDSPVNFRSDGRTLHDLEQRFRAEDEHLIEPDLHFRWDMLSDPLLNYRLF